ncbi:MAG: HAMP domain-containing histidine kinase [Rhodocyclaceae bacterium]|jgi:signal transduction histidine kinase|nr:HAMP domain-containing histidine kinase [Rhodocyclaceae bacterium]
MTHSPSLRRRIVVAFVLMTLVVAGLFSLTVLMAVSYTEENYSSYTMNRQLDDLLHALDRGLPFQLDQDMVLYVVGGDGQPALPDWLGTLKPGFQEAYRGEKEFHVMVRDVEGKRYVLLLDQEELDRREDALKLILFAAFLVSVLAAWALGSLMARRVIEPVTRLAGQVQRREQLLPEAPKLADGYPSDEVGALASAFDATLGQLRQALERERIFTSDVSHELRTPLMVIASSCDLMLAQGLADSRQQVPVRRIQSACAEMQELVETFLRLARSHDGERAEAEATLAQIAGEQIDRLRPEAADRGIAFELLNQGEDTGRYPSPLLRAVISNLLRNAIHYTDRGYVRLVLRAGGFSVLDTGTGIPPEQRESVFRPFVRGDASRGDGLGLGLSLVQRICRLQGWRIALEENPSGGCAFRVDFSAP